MSIRIKDGLRYHMRIIRLDWTWIQTFDNPRENIHPAVIFVHPTIDLLSFGSGNAFIMTSNPALINIELLITHCFYELRSYVSWAIYHDAICAPVWRRPLNLRMFPELCKIPLTSCNFLAENILKPFETFSRIFVVATMRLLLVCQPRINNEERRYYNFEWSTM